MRIVFDLDDTLVNFAEALLLFHNNNYGTDLKMDDFHSYDFCLVWGGTREEEKQKIRNFFASKEFLQMSVIEGAKEFISLLTEDNELHIVTARPLYSAESTMKAVSKDFGDTFKDVHLSTHAFGMNGNSRTKKEICDEINADVVIEDSADNANSVVNSHRKVFLFNRPWNKNIPTDPRVMRVDTWEEILKNIKKN